MAQHVGERADEGRELAVKALHAPDRPAVLTCLAGVLDQPEAVGSGHQLWKRRERRA